MKHFCDFFYSIYNQHIVLLRVIDEGSVPETYVKSILLKSNFNMVCQESSNLFLLHNIKARRCYMYFN